jgi:probable HAF family extracellular repeat protein
MENSAMDSRQTTGKACITLTFTLAVLLSASRADAVPLYTLTNFGSAIPLAIDDAGDVVLDGAGPYDGVYHSYGPNAGQVTPLSAFGLSSYAASDVAIAGLVNSGTVFGQIPVGNSENAFISSGGQVTDLGALPGYSSTGAVAANASGVVVGNAYSATSASSIGFIYQNGQITSIGISPTAINSSGQIIGLSISSSNPGSFLYQNGSLTQLPTLGGTQNIAFAINAQGQVVGNSSLAGSSGPGTIVLNAYLYSNGKMLDLGTLPGGGNSEATGINNSSQVVGDSGGHAFLWQNGTMYNLADLLTVPAPFPLSYSMAINNAGQIIGVYDNAGTLTGFMLTPDNLPTPAYIPPDDAYNVPEPSTLVLFGVVALTCILGGRSRRNRA